MKVRRQTKETKRKQKQQQNNIPERSSSRIGISFHVLPQNFGWVVDSSTKQTIDSRPKQSFTLVGYAL